MTQDERSNFPDAEWKARVDLAAAYRLTDHFGMTSLIYNHITARVPDTEDQFLINEYGLGYEEVTASNLVTIDMDGNILDEGDHRINVTGYVIHSAIHAARHDVTCVMHTHTPYGMAVSALAKGLMPLQQDGYEFHERVAYHEFEGVAVDIDERERLVTDLGDKNAMIMRNHGLLTVGRSVAEAWLRMWQLEQACKVQVLAQSTGQAIRRAPLPAIEQAAALADREPVDLEWAWLLRTIDRKDSSYRN
ncbi:MAG: class II aldolase/adducin family protein [Chloroflexota bacterium]|nr:class II aldolase/adducin family protein [Chloroflexota bacterium]MDE2941287.1 class II aldolase/adducin family protein [Chloroflexota bacterium]MDE3267780.1 class II aldolase/adducin family protein [Chloroflexota bacterium]